MKFGSLTISTAVVIAVVAGAALWLSWCHDPSVRREVQLQMAGDTTDARVARLAADQIEREAAWRRTENDINRRNVILLHRADSLARALASRVIVVAGDSLIPKPAVDSLLAAKDSVIAQDARFIGAQAGRILALEGSLAAYQTQLRDAISQREAWRRAAKPNLLTRIVREAPLLGVAYLLGRAKVP